MVSSKKQKITSHTAVFSQSNFLYPTIKSTSNEEIEMLSDANEALQEHFKEMCDIKGAKIYN